MKTTISLFMIILILDVFSLGVAGTEAPPLSKAVFYVQ